MRLHNLYNAECAYDNVIWQFIPGGTKTSGWDVRKSEYSRFAVATLADVERACACMIWHSNMSISARRCSRSVWTWHKFQSYLHGWN